MCWQRVVHDWATKHTCTQNENSGQYFHYFHYNLSEPQTLGSLILKQKTRLSPMDSFISSNKTHSVHCQKRGSLFLSVFRKSKIWRQVENTVEKRRGRKREKWAQQHCLFLHWLRTALFPPAPHFFGMHLLYNTVLVSTIQQSESAVCIHISPLFWISCLFRSPQSAE